MPQRSALRAMTWGFKGQLCPRTVASQAIAETGHTSQAK